MEKVFIQSAVNTGKTTKTGTPIISVTLGDGRTGSCMDLKIIACIGQSIDMEVKDGKPYNGVMQYYFNFPKNGQAATVPGWQPTPQPQQPQMPDSFAERQAALDLAMKYHNLTGVENVRGAISTAETILDWLKK